MNEATIRKEGADLNLVLLLLLKKVKWILVGTVLCTLIAGGIYMAMYMADQGRAPYRCESKFYITFEEIGDKTYFDYYYNGYAWDELFSSDAVLGEAMKQLPAYERSYVDACMSADILADVRILTITIKAASAAEALQFQEAITASMLHFATVGEKIEAIELISHTEPQRQVVDNVLWRALLLGAVLGFVGSIWIQILMIAIDKGVYLPEQLEERYGIPCTGVLLAGEGESDIMRFLDGEGVSDEEDVLFFHRELKANLAYVMRGRDVNAVSVEELESCSEDLFAKLRVLDGIVLLVPQGKGNARILSRTLRNLSQQKIKVLGCVLTHCNRAFLRSYYYGDWKKKETSSKEEL